MADVQLIRFTARWCKPCQRLAPLLKGIEGEFPEVDFEVVDIDEHPVVAEAYGVMSVPTVLLKVNGQVQHSWSGGVTARNVAQRLREAVGR